MGVRSIGMFVLFNPLTVEFCLYCCILVGQLVGTWIRCDGDCLGVGCLM